MTSASAIIIRSNPFDVVNFGGEKERVAVNWFATRSVGNNPHRNTTRTAQIFMDRHIKNLILMGVKCVQHRGNTSSIKCTKFSL